MQNVRCTAQVQNTAIQHTHPAGCRQGVILRDDQGDITTRAIISAHDGDLSGNCGSIQHHLATAASLSIDD